MTSSAVRNAFIAILVGMLVAILSTSIVGTSLPNMVADLHGDQSTLTWIVTSSLLALTVGTPLWGKLSDLLDKKLLIQVALVAFIVGTIVSAIAPSPALMITGRVVQGIGAGGMLTLAQIVLSDILAPRERGRYMGVLGSVVLVGTAGGPLVGGVITDVFGWRWNFLLLVPIAVIAIVVIQATLRLPRRKRPVVIDYAGIVGLTIGVSVLLVWLSLAGRGFAWSSPISWCLSIGSGIVLFSTVIVELRAREPILPLSLFRDRTFTLAVIAAFAIGISLYSISVYLSQYMQLARSATSAEAGLLTLPQTIGNIIGSIVIGSLVSRSGRWKQWMVIGAVFLTLGLGLLATLRAETPIVPVFAYMAITGVGIGMLLQNLVLVVQNSVSVLQVGAATSAVTFFRSLGGTIGVTVLGLVLSTRVQALLSVRGSPSSDTIPDIAALSGPMRAVVQSAYGAGIGLVFLCAAPLAAAALLCVIFLPNRPLSTRTGIERLAEIEAESP